MKGIIASFGAVLLASSAWAGASIKSGAVPLVDNCEEGTCDLNPVSCTTNSDCDFGSLSAKSKASLGADGRFKAQLKGLVDGDGLEASGDYMLYFGLDTTSTTTSGVMKITVDGGSAKIDLDLSEFIGGPGEATSLTDSYLMTPPPVPADCPGAGNSAADMAMRVGDSDCFSGEDIGTLGVVAGGKSTIKAFVAPVIDTCDGSCVENGTSCTTNADCNFGSVSPKSKASISGAGRLKVQLKDVVDSAGVEASGDYMLQIALQRLPQSQLVEGLVKVTIDGGKGKADVDLGTLFVPAGSTMNLSYSSLRTEPTVPTDCPGDGNTADDVVARASDPDCYSGRIIARVGVVAE